MNSHTPEQTVCQNTSPNKRSVLIVDDHPIVREGLTDLIDREDDITVCGSAKDIPEAMQAIKELKPDVVTVDISLDCASGLDLIKDIAGTFAGLPILALSMHQETTYAKRAITAGAKGYITKHEPTKTIIAAIREVLDGRLYLSETMKDNLLYSLVNDQGPNSGTSLVDRLTNRELEVLTLLGQGNTTRQIAQQLDLSVKTIETYRARIKERLNLRNGSELLQYAYRWFTKKDKDGAL